MKVENKVRSVVAALTVLLAVFLTGCGSSSDDGYTGIIKAVRGGYRTDSPGVTYGLAFDQFFENGKWSSHENIVEFKGTCKRNGQKVKAHVVFRISNETFKKFDVVGEERGTFYCEYISLGGKSLPPQKMIQFLDEVLSSAKPGVYW